MHWCYLTNKNLHVYHQEATKSDDSKKHNIHSCAEQSFLLSASNEKFYMLEVKTNHRKRIE